MRNFLIRLLGGLTPDESYKLVTGYNSAESIRMQQVQHLEKQCANLETERKELQTIILKKTGMIPPEKQTPSIDQILHPITTRPKSWREQRAELEKRDADRVAEQWRKKDPEAKEMKNAS